MACSTCKYCGWDFEVTERHKAEGLHHFCSHGCRIGHELPASHGGQTFVSSDSNPGILNDAAAATLVDTKSDAPMSHYAEVLRFAFRWVCQCDRDQREAVLMRADGRRYEDIGYILSITPQAAEQHVRTAMRKFHVFRLMFADKAEKQRRKGKRRHERDS